MVRGIIGIRVTITIIMTEVVAEAATTRIAHGGQTIATAVDHRITGITRTVGTTIVATEVVAAEVDGITITTEDGLIEIIVG